MLNKAMIEKISELIENCSHSARLLIKAEACLKNGDLQGTQKHTKEAVQLVSVMQNDVFLEIAEMFQIETADSAEIEDLDTLELCRHLCDIVYQAGVLLNLLQDNTTAAMCQQVETTIMQQINAVKKLYAALFAN